MPRLINYSKLLNKFIFGADTQIFFEKTKLSSFEILDNLIQTFEHQKQDFFQQI